MNLKVFSVLLFFFILQESFAQNYSVPVVREPYQNVKTFECPGANGISQNSPIIKEFSASTDTLHFYIKKTNRDSVEMQYYKIYRDKDVYRVMSHRSNIYILKYKYKNLKNISAEKEDYKRLRRYNFPIERIETLVRIEDLIRVKANIIQECSYKYEFVLKHKENRLKSKKRQCGQEMVNLFLNLIVGELEKDSNNLIRE